MQINDQGDSLVTLNLQRNKVWFFVKLAVSLGLIAYLVSIVDWDRAVKTVRQANKLPILIAPFCLWLGFGVSSLRWQLVLADNQVTYSYKQTYKGYLFGSFYSIFLPGVIGGDAVRIALCVRQTKCEIGTATASVLLERVAGVLALLSFLLCVHLLFPSTLPSLVTVEPTLSVIAVVIVSIIVIITALLGRHIWIKWFPREDDRGIWIFVYSGIQTLDTLKGQTLGAVLILSALFQAMDIAATFLLSQAIGLTITLPVFFVINPLVYLATVLPISLGGLGVREGALVFLLSKFGVATSDAVTLSFLIYLNRIVVGALGGLVQLIGTVSSAKIDGVAESTHMVETFDHRESRINQ